MAYVIHYPDTSRGSWESGATVVKAVCNEVPFRSKTSTDITKVTCKKCKKKVLGI